MYESLVAADAGLVHGQVDEFLLGGDETDERPPRSDVAVLAIESLVDRGDRAGRMHVVPAKPGIIGHPTEWEDQSNGESDSRRMGGDRCDNASGDVLQALDSWVRGHEISRSVGFTDRVLTTHPVWQN
jgi:hypothetical protein